MKNAIIVHGMPDKDEYLDPVMPSTSNAHWIPWLQKQLLINGIDTQTPEMLDAWQPDYAVWKNTFERFLCTPETLLIGHSCGAGFLVRWLSEHPEVTVRKVVLVAPWLDPQRDNTTGFFDFAIDPMLASRTERMTVFNSDDDFASVQESVRRIRTAVPGIDYREFHEYGHFCVEDLGTQAFPELLEEALQYLS